MSAAPPESLFASPQLGWTGAWLPDGSALITVATEMVPGSGADIALLTNAGRGPLVPVVATPYTEQYPALSPDGRWLAYVSDQSGREEVYVRALVDGDEAVQVSLDGGTEPVWRRDGREIAYRGATEGRPELALAAVQAGAEFGVSSRRVLFSLADYVGTNPHPNFDYTPDGRGFVMVRRSQATRIMVIQNLPELVRRLQGAAGR